MINRKLSIAPMMAYTDRHFRYLLRLITQHTVLFTEMVTAQAIVFGDQSRLLDFSDEEHPVVMQLGGSEPEILAKAAVIVADKGYDEINLNVGCPSERVQKGCFGAALMKEAALVAQCFRAMQDAVEVPVTIKTRLGVDEYDSDAFLHDFIGRQIEAGCKTFVIHARKAWLKGLSPKENRTIPPLQYERVYRLKEHFQDIEIILNGGLENIESALLHCEYLNGVMLGRSAIAHPYQFAQADTLYFNESVEAKSRLRIVAEYLPYVLKHYALGVPMRHLTRHLIPLFQGEIGAKQWRRLLSDGTMDDRQLIRAIEGLL